MSYYKILNLEENAKEQDIKKAFRQKALEYHPLFLINFLNFQDKTIYEIEEAREKFRELDEAYKVLSNDDKRALYDVYHRHKEEIEKYPQFNPKILNMIRKLYMEMELQQEKQSLINEEMLNKIPSVDIDRLLRAYETQQLPNKEYYAQKGKYLSDYLEREVQDALNKKENCQKNEYFDSKREMNKKQQTHKCANIERKEDKWSNKLNKKETQEEAPSSNFEKKPSENIQNTLMNQFKSYLSDEISHKSESSQPFKDIQNKKTNDDFSQKYYKLINSFSDQQINDFNNQPIRDYANKYDRSLSQQPLSLPFIEQNGSMLQQKLTKKQIKYLWQVTQQKKVQKRISKKLPIFSIQNIPSKKRAPAQWQAVQEKLTIVQQQIQQHLKYFQKMKNRKGGPSILDISKQKYLELVLRKKLLTQQSRSILNETPSFMENIQQEEYDPTNEPFYHQFREELSTSANQNTNKIFDFEQGQRSNIGNSSQLSNENQIILNEQEIEQANKQQELSPYLDNCDVSDYFYESELAFGQDSQQNTNQNLNSLDDYDNSSNFQFIKQYSNKIMNNQNISSYSSHHLPSKIGNPLKQNVPQLNLMNKQDSKIIERDSCEIDCSDISNSSLQEEFMEKNREDANKIVEQLQKQQNIETDISGSSAAIPLKLSPFEPCEQLQHYSQQQSPFSPIDDHFQNEQLDFNDFCYNNYYYPEYNTEFQNNQPLNQNCSQDLPQLNP